MDEDDIVEMSDNIIYDIERRFINNQTTDEDKINLLDELISSLSNIKEDLM